MIKQYYMKLQRVLRLVKRYGVRGLYYKAQEKWSQNLAEYEQWRKENELTKEELEKQRQWVFPSMPLISILVPVYETPLGFLEELLKSVQGQTYKRWELCLADASETDEVQQFVRAYCETDERIRYQRLKQNRGISDNTNEALRMALGSYVGLLDHDDLLAENALFEVVRVINEGMIETKTGIDVIYSDEDKIGSDSLSFFEPHFKSDFNPHLLRSNNYICHFLVVKRELAKTVGGFRKEFDGAQDYDFILRCTEKAKNIKHIAKILYHWRVHVNSTSGNTESKLYAYEAGKRAVAAHLKRIGVQEATVEPMLDLGFYKIIYDTVQIQQEKKIAILRWDFSTDQDDLAADLNRRIETEDANYILLLNERIQKITPCWEGEFLGILENYPVGVVGGKLYNSKNKLCGTAVSIDEQEIVSDFLKELPKHYKGYFRRAVLCQNVSGLTPDLLLISKEIFQQVGGFDVDLGYASFFIDFCFRLQEKGYDVVWNPAVVGTIKDGKNQEEVRKISLKDKEKLVNRWNKYLQRDIYYNSNFKQGTGDFSIK